MRPLNRLSLAHSVRHTNNCRHTAKPTRCVSCVARLPALARRFALLVQTDVAADYADLARLGHVTRARGTQIMNLLGLAPNIQEAILFLAPVSEGKDLV